MIFAAGPGKGCEKLAFDTRAFRNALGCFPTGVTLVTARTAARHPMGITVNSFAAVSLEPPLILWCMQRRSQRFETFVKAEVFTVSVLDATHAEVSSRLARPGEHRLDGIPLLETRSGAPALADALAVFECRREAVYDGGDHAVLLGRVVQFAFRDKGAPLIFFRGRYHPFSPTGPAR
ncbi:MAG TPA: flavin reductase family protein [Rhizomicrobium sp.]|nr:flavin reductase family protein [Rhizomicrobium sp.]